MEKKFIVEQEAKSLTFLKKESESLSRDRGTKVLVFTKKEDVELPPMVETAEISDFKVVFVFKKENE